MSFVVLFSVNATQHPKMSCQLQYLLLCFSAWILFTSPILPVSYDVFCSTLQWEYLLTSTSCQLQYLLWYFSAWKLHNIPKLPVSYNIFCGTFQRERYAAYQNFLSVAISFAVPFRVNTTQHTSTSCLLARCTWSCGASLKGSVGWRVCNSGSSTFR